jgi:hypothetical protein
MAAMEEVGKMLGGRIGGRHSSSMAAARAGLKVDVTELKKMSKEFDVIRQSVRNLRKEMDDLHTSAAKAGAAVSSASSGGSTGTSAAGTPKPPAFHNSSVPVGGAGGAGTTPPGTTTPGTPGGGSGAFAGMRAMFARAGIGTGTAKQSAPSTAATTAYGTRHLTLIV